VARQGDIPLEPPLVAGPGIVRVQEDRSYLLFIAAALTSALAGGFLLAVWGPLATTGDLAPSERAPWMVQAHGWIQLQGWAGLFVAGMAVRLIPRFAGRKPVPRSVTLPLLAALCIPVALRIGLQPYLAPEANHRVGLIISLATVPGTLGVAAVLAFVLVRGRKPAEPWRYFAWAGAGWWAAWACLSLYNVDDDSLGLFQPPRNDAFQWAVMLGAIGNFIWGVQSRSVPVFFGRKPPKLSAVAVPATALNLGAALVVFGSWSDQGERLAGTGFVLAGAALVWLPPVCGAVWGRARRLRPRARPAARFIVAANLSAVAAGSLLVYSGIRMIGSGDGQWAAPFARDASRHLLGIGTISMLILGMARLIAPVFALERTENGVPRLLERAPFWLLVGAVILRPGAALFGDQFGFENRMHTASLAGALAWLAIAIFAASVLRAARAEPRTQRSLEAAATAAAARRKSAR
jgi:hypothetical protein